MNTAPPIDTLSLFPVLDEMLMELLNGLTPEEWHAQTVARLWKVKDVASHLLDGNLRGLSISRDRFFGEPAGDINSYQDLVSFLNEMNASWVKATKRLSPRVLIHLLEITGKQYSSYLQSLDPFANAIFPVAWAGQEISSNWFHIAREYTEKFLHQQQIRQAVNRPGLMTRELFYPFIDTLMFALPYTFRDTEAQEGQIISVIITEDIGGQWNIIRESGQWILNKQPSIIGDAIVRIPPATAWQLFSKSLSPDAALDHVQIKGRDDWAKQALEIVAVMA